MFASSSPATRTRTSASASSASGRRSGPTGPEGYIAELYVVGDHRGRGLGAELMEAMLALARELGCEWIELGTDENDTDAHRLYERFGFSNFNPGAPEGERERMLVYEREL